MERFKWHEYFGKHCKRKKKKVFVFFYSETASGIWIIFHLAFIFNSKHKQSQVACFSVSFLVAAQYIDITVRLISVWMHMKVKLKIPKLLSKGNHILFVLLACLHIQQYNWLAIWQADKTKGQQEAQNVIYHFYFLFEVWKAFQAAFIKIQSYPAKINI